MTSQSKMLYTHWKLLKGKNKMNNQSQHSWILTFDITFRCAFVLWYDCIECSSFDWFHSLSSSHENPLFSPFLIFEFSCTANCYRAFISFGQWFKLREQAMKITKKVSARKSRVTMPTHKTCVQVANFVIQRMKCMCVRVGIAFGCVWNVFFFCARKSRAVEILRKYVASTATQEDFLWISFFSCVCFLGFNQFIWIHDVEYVLVRRSKFLYMSFAWNENDTFFGNDAADGGVKFFLSSFALLRFVFVLNKLVKFSGQKKLWMENSLGAHFH